MNKEKALKNQGLEFREDIWLKGGICMIIPMTDDERRLTEEYLYLVPEMVKKLTSRCAYVSYDEQQDLLQAGNLALCKAAMNYEIGRASCRERVSSPV